MFAFLEKYLAYRRLKPIVVALPTRLAKAFGPSKHYTFLQAKRAIFDVKIGARAAPYAFAAACTLEELEKNGAGVLADDYRRMRMELADLFGLPTVDFTMDKLRSKTFNMHHPAEENVYAGSGGGHH
jgi:hypothetical protein